MAHQTVSHNGLVLDQGTIEALARALAPALQNVSAGSRKSLDSASGRAAFKADQVLAHSSEMSSVQSLSGESLNESDDNLGSVPDPSPRAKRAVSGTTKKSRGSKKVAFKEAGEDDDAGDEAGAFDYVEKDESDSDERAAAAGFTPSTSSAVFTPRWQANLRPKQLPPEDCVVPAGVRAVGRFPVTDQVHKETFSRPSVSAARRDEGDFMYQTTAWSRDVANAMHSLLLDMDNLSPADTKRALLSIWQQSAAVYKLNSSRYEIVKSDMEKPRKKPVPKPEPVQTSDVPKVTVPCSKEEPCLLVPECPGLKKRKPICSESGGRAVVHSRFWGEMDECSRPS